MLNGLSCLTVLALKKIIINLFKSKNNLTLTSQDKPWYSGGQLHCSISNALDCPVWAWVAVSITTSLKWAEVIPILTVALISIASTDDKASKNSCLINVM